MNTHFKPSRRDLLKGGGALVVSFSLVAAHRRRRSRKAAAPQRPLALTEVDAFLAIDATRPRHGLFRQGRSRHRRHAPRCAQIAAEELDVPFSAVKLVAGRHRAHARPGQDLGQPHHPARRHADPQRGGDRARGAARGGRQAARRPSRGPHRHRRRHQRPATSSVSYGELIGGKMFSHQARPRQAGEGQGPEGLQDRRQVGAARRHPRQGDRALHLHAGLPRARHAARPRGAAAGDRRQARKRRRRLDQEHPRHRQGRARGQFPRRRGAERVGRDQGGATAQGDLVEMGRACPSRPSSTSTCARTKVVQGRGDQQCRQHRRGDGQGGRRRSSPPPTTSPSTPHGSIGPSCAVAEFKDGKLTSWSASQATHDLRKQLAQMFAHAGRERALHLSRRLRLLRPQRPRGRRRRRRAARQGGRQAGARAVVARRRARLGPEGPADADRPARGARRRRQRHGLGVGVLHSAADGGQLHGAADRRRRSPACRQKPTSRPATSSRTRRSPTSSPTCKTVCHRLETTPFRPSWIRTPGRMQNTYANECFMDELAAAAGMPTRSTSA